FSCNVSIFSLFQIVKEQYRKHDLVKSSLRYFSVHKEPVIMSFTHYRIGVPKGIRTPVTAVKGQCPTPRWGDENTDQTEIQPFRISMSRNS
ncbi:hypothetical protein, partial [Yersinia pestis]|uniref:hypothetical protein n=1 Tax=Yersinia pestis TaxID=632 RepID=UPI001ED8C09A